ncbi:hypothetical protein EJ08DRAFT_692937 [Tothia fuscella]|uniref:F-box domain-containing protein n=1 Tax=Tothia fuscella TaxID=1048955 RepID=A0A9P4U3H9_9PEZI|nr:hypothetical protein EJ08DRAFT_692937 [Tothia fuscella]
MKRKRISGGKAKSRQSKRDANEQSTTHGKISKRSKMKSNDDISQTPKPASLLGLPKELGLQILGYLLPDLTNIPYRHPVQRFESFRWRSKGPGYPQMSLEEKSSSEYVSFRKDGAGCWPRVLCVNSMIRDECLDVMHKSKIFDLEIESDIVGFGSGEAHGTMCELSNVTLFLQEALPPKMEAIRVTVGKHDRDLERDWSRI